MNRTTADYNPIIDDSDFLEFESSPANEIVVSDLSSRNPNIEFDEQLASAQQQLKELKKQEEQQAWGHRLLNLPQDEGLCQGSHWSWRGP